MDGTPGVIGSWANMKTNEITNQQNEGNNMKTQTVDEWWAKLPPGQKGLAHQIALMIQEVSESKRIEIRKECAAIRARFIHILHQPEKGCLSAIIVPEPSGKRWN